uniref:Vomeronasal type-1 receptor n=1 Tax=Leptobrachium leishanense TaxID=445787 RepID=A0A8C5MLG4_9ANUR
MDLLIGFKAAAFLFLLTVGIPGNVFILLQFTYIRVFEKKLLPTNMILMALAAVNLLVLLSRCIPESLNSLGVKDLLDDPECKLVLFCFRVNRAMSICVTSFLSCYQCILIAPKRGLWLWIKKTIRPNVLIILITLLFINLSVYPYYILNARARRNLTTSPYTLNLLYCDADFLTYFAYVTTGSIYAIRDFISVGLMTASGGYIVYRLVCHERSMKGMRSTDKFQSRTVEQKASRAVILLVSLYVLLFGLENSMWIYTLTLSNANPDMNEIRIFLASSYSAFSAIVIISTNPRFVRSSPICFDKKEDKAGIRTIKGFYL